MSQLSIIFKGNIVDVWFLSKNCSKNKEEFLKSWKGFVV